MLHITAILEDNQIVLKQTSENLWTGTIADGLTGTEMEIEASGEVVSAIFALALHTDGVPVDDETTTKLYAIVEPWCKANGMQDGGPNVKLRPIP